MQRVVHLPQTVEGRAEDADGAGSTPAVDTLSSDGVIWQPHHIQGVMAARP